MIKKRKTSDLIQTEWQSVYRIKKILKKKCIKFLVILCLFFKSTVDRWIGESDRKVK